MQRSVRSRPGALERRKGLVGLALRGLAPGLHIRSGDRLRGKGRVVRLDRQGAVQFRGAASKRADLLEIDRVPLGRRYRSCCLDQPHLVENAIEIAEGEGPAVA